MCAVQCTNSANSKVSCVIKVVQTEGMKHRAEDEKEARKRKRIEAKVKKDKLVPAVTIVKRKLFTKTGVDFSFTSHHKTITSQSGRGLRCDYFNNVFHVKCIPKYHKEHIPISEDGDESSVTCVKK